MAYRFKAGESVPENVKRIACEEIGAAVDNLTGKNGSNRDENIHEARKNVKKLRALLRLMRPELGGVYRTENESFRDASRALSGLRDASAIIESFDDLVKTYRDKSGTGHVTSIRRDLVAQKRAGDQHAEPILNDAASRFGLALERVNHWPLRKDGFGAIALGLEATFRQGREALARAEKQGHAEDFHELRKAVKAHWYHLRLLENLWTDVLQAQEKSLKDLETWLGEDHNLFVIDEKIRHDSIGAPADSKIARELIAKRQAELRENSLSLAVRVYAEKPRRLSARFEHLWDAWQSEPKSFKHQEEEQPDGNAARKKSAAKAAPSRQLRAHAG